MVQTNDSDRLFRATASAPVHGRLEGHVGVVQQPRRFPRPGRRMQEKLVRRCRRRRRRQRRCRLKDVRRRRERDLTGASAGVRVDVSLK